MKDYPFTELQLKWLEELESGKHKQCKYVLHDGVGYCCLGVAARFVLVVEPQWAGEFCRFGGLHDVLSPPLQKKLGLRTGAGGGKYTGDSLASMNDEDRMSFSEIAKYIRENPDDVFTNLDNAESRDNPHP